MIAGATRGVETFLSQAEKLFFILANTCLMLMLVLNAINIAWRGIFDVSLNLVWPWTGLLFVWMCFFGFYVIYRRGKDITVEFFVDLAGPSLRHVTRLMSDLIIVALMLLLLVEAPRTLASQVGEMELIEMNRYWMSVPLFASAALVGLHFALDFVNALRGVPELRKDFDVPE